MTIPSALDCSLRFDFLGACYIPNAVGGIDGPGSADAVTFFGTDYSAEPIEITVNEIPNLGISRDVLEMLERKNAAVVSAIQGISCYQEC